jgi:hypothetical protein
MNRSFNNDSRLTTLDAVLEQYSNKIDKGSIFSKVKLKCWLQHSESRHRNGNMPFTLSNYANHMNNDLYLEHVLLDLIDCLDLGGKEAVVSYLTKLHCNLV